MSNSKKVKGIIYIILTAILLMLLSITMYKVYLKSEPEKEENKNNTTNEVSESKYPKEFNKAYDAYRLISVKEKELYDEDGFNINELTTDELVSSLFRIVSNETDYILFCSSMENTKGFTIDTANELLGKYILNKKITMDDIKSVATVSPNTNDLVISPGYTIILKENVMYLYGPCDFGMYGPTDYVEKKTVDYKITDDYVYIYEKQAFLKVKTDDTGVIKYDVYKDYDKTELITEDVISIGVNTITDWEAFDTYKYTVKRSNGNYYFESFTKEK